MLFRFGLYTLDTSLRELKRDSMPVAVEPQVFDLVEHLLRNRERVVSRDEVFASIWSGRVVSDSTLDTRLNAARAAIGDSGAEQRLIKTFPRKGFRFVGAVLEEDAELRLTREGLIVSEDLPSIAVLPFTNMSSDTEQGYLADGIAEEIITALSRCRWLMVIARNSSFSYKGRTGDVRLIGRELGVRYILEGSVKRSGERLRITGQLSDASAGTTLWAERFEGRRDDVFDLQDSITASVVGAIEPTLQQAEIARLARRPAVSVDAYELLLQAQQQEYEFTRESLQRAIRFANEALRLDSSYAPAMALAAFCYAARRFQGWTIDIEQETRIGLQLADDALRIARDDANVLWMAAYAIRELGLDPKRSQEIVGRSLGLNPSSAMALTISAWNDIVLGHPGEARAALSRAEQLSPRDPRAWFAACADCLACIAQHDFTAAASRARSALTQNPRSAQAARLLASSLAHLGDTLGAAAALRHAVEIEPDLTLASLRVRLRFMPVPLWLSLSTGLKMAGLR